MKEECEVKAMTGKNLLVEGKHRAKTHTHIPGDARGSRVTQDAFRLCTYKALVALHNEDAPQTFSFFIASQLNDPPRTECVNITSSSHSV